MSSNCSRPLTHGESLVITMVQTSLYIAAFLISLLLLVTSACLRFRRRISIERTETQFVVVGCVLSLYSLVSSFHWVTFYEESNNATAEGCTAVAVFSQYNLLCLLVATSCIGVHLILLLWQPKFLSVIEEQKRNRYKCLEILYITLIIFVPLIFLPWPFISRSYGKTGHLCWIREHGDSNCNTGGFIEQIVLYYLWSFLVFGFTTAVALVILVTLCRRRTPRKGDANIYALLCYMIIFVIANVVGVVVRIYNRIEYPVHSYPLEFVQSVIFPLRTAFIAATLLIRVCYMYAHRSSKEYKRLAHVH